MEYWEKKTVVFFLLLNKNAISFRLNILFLINNYIIISTLIDGSMLQYRFVIQANLFTN